jgi:hypothetical protein
MQNSLAASTSTSATTSGAATKADYTPLAANITVSATATA